MNPNLAERLLERARTHPERAAIVQYRGGRPRRISFGELAERVARTAGGIRAAGVRPGGRVLLFVPMSIDLYVALLAVMHAGATAIFVDAWADRRRLDAAVAAARPDLFVGPPKAHLLRILSPSIRRLSAHWIGGGRALPLRRYERSAIPPALVEGDDPALVTFTTGSTGAPKAAARTHRFLWAQHEVLSRHLGLRPGDVDMPTLPIFVLNDLALGITSVLPEFDPRRPASIDPARIVRQMEAEGVTTTSGSPAFYDRLLTAVEPRGQRLHLRGLWTGGAPVHPSLARRLRDGVRGEAHVVYGSTEAEPIAGIEAGAMLEAMEQRDWTGGICCGMPVPEIDLRIIRPVDGPVALGAGGWAEWAPPAGEAGEIVVAGPHVLGAYLDAEEETRRHKIPEGERVWHRTGDAGWIDDEGRLWLVGRVSARLERGGRTWWSVPAEIRAMNVRGVRHAAYLGVRGGEGEVRALLAIEAAEGAFGGDPLSLFRERVAPNPLDEVRVLRRIPRDPRHASKTDTAALLRILEAGGNAGDLS